jgi:hypothetical protein
MTTPEGQGGSMHQDREELNLRLPPAWQAPPDIQNRLGAQVGRQRAIIDESLADDEKSPLLLVLHEIPERAVPRQGVFYWLDLNRQWFVYRQGQPYDAAEDGLAALRDHFARYEAVQEELRADYEQARRAHHYLAILENVAQKSHAAENLHRTMETARTFMREKKIDYEAEIINLRDRAYNLEREFDLLYQDTQNALDYREARSSEILNLLVLIFFPLTLVTSLIQTGITDQILTIAPALDPLIMTLCLLFAAILVGIGLSLLIDPTHNQRRAKKVHNRNNSHGRAPQAQPAQRPASKIRQPSYAHPLARWRIRKQPVTLDEKMAHYAVNIPQQQEQKKK